MPRSAAGIQHSVLFLHEHPAPARGELHVGAYQPADEPSLPAERSTHRLAGSHGAARSRVRHDGKLERAGRFPHCARCREHGAAVCSRSECGARTCQRDGRHVAPVGGFSACRSCAHVRRAGRPHFRRARVVCYRRAFSLAQPRNHQGSYASQMGALLLARRMRGDRRYRRAP